MHFLTCNFNLNQYKQLHNVNCHIPQIMDTILLCNRRTCLTYFVSTCTLY